MSSDFAGATRAVAGIVQRADGALLMQRRTEGQSYTDYWEFPGGKVEVDSGETADAALRRELMEEVGIKTEQARHFVRRYWQRAGGGTVIVDFFIVSAWQNEPQSREGQPLCWVSPNDLPTPLLPANAVICQWLNLPPFCLITAAEQIGEERMLHCLEKTLSNVKPSDAPQHCVILRDKTLPNRKAFATKVLSLCRPRGVLVFAADDETLAAQADGLHLSAAKLLAQKTRPSFKWVGASCHNAEELNRAVELGLDYALLSPVCQTQSHPDATPLGWEQFANIADNARLLIYALGGLGMNDLNEARQHGAHGVAFMREVWE